MSLFCTCSDTILCPGMRILRWKLSLGLYVEHLHVGASVAAVVLECFFLKPVRLGSKFYLYYSLLVFYYD